MSRRKADREDIEMKRFKEKRKKEDKIMVGIVIIIILGGVGGYFVYSNMNNGSNDDLDNNIIDPTNDQNDPNDNSGTLKEFRVIAKQWSFSPSTITVNKGDKVRLILSSPDVAHGIGIIGYDVNEYIPAGQESTVEFVAENDGRFNIYCNVHCGSGHGNMKGTFVVN
jgi:cytochrome c oxidase subunit 2